ncbi:hypothetical protein FM125_04935 [Micrococcus lylae]|uniref:Uncharacterized protein n=1 Tax=Micrococcus lylae TaxID=1273 RepID=A0A1R4IXK8_9MICC|nr:hypothetical protein FM125_04935 [Micrococcus lylae]
MQTHVAELSAHTKDCHQGNGAGTGPVSTVLTSSAVGSTMAVVPKA